MQEALTNVRKHARAHTVRVLSPGVTGGLIYCWWRAMVSVSGCPGEHIGCALMAERAARIGADWSIESEPEQGTRVELVFPIERKAPAPT